MDESSTIISNKNNTKELLKAQTYIWTQIYSFLSSMALKCAIQLQIPDTIHNHGKPMTLNELITSLSIHPSKETSLYRILRFLVQSNFLSKSYLDNGEEAYSLTINSQLLLKNHPMTLAPFALAVLDPTLTDPTHHLGSWFQNEEYESRFHSAHGSGFWEYTSNESRFNDYFNKAMASDAKFVGDILMDNSEFKGLFEGVRSLVDVGGGTGTLARVIAKGFTEVKCIVLDLPHVVQGLQNNNDVEVKLDFVGGDMFDSIPPGDVMLLKSIMHDWDDRDCVRILEQCRDAIPTNEQGGKVIIIDVVMDTQNDDMFGAQVKFGVNMMSLTTGGKERTEDEWNRLFKNAGYVGYKFFKILGFRSVIVVYPP